MQEIVDQSLVELWKNEIKNRIWECACEKTNNEDNTISNNGLEMILKCDKQTKEEIIRTARENNIKNTSVVGNVALQCVK